MVAGAAHHDAERAFGCALAAAADRCVEHENALLAQRRRHLTRRLRADRAAVDDECAWLCAVDHALLAQDHRLHVGRVADAGDDDVAACGDIGGTGAGMRTLPHQPLHPRDRAVPDCQLEASLEQVGRHPLPHNAEADKTDAFGHICIPCLIR